MGIVQNRDGIFGIGGDRKGSDSSGCVRMVWDVLGWFAICEECSG